MNFSKKEKMSIIFSFSLMLFLFSTVDSSAMHIMEGYLPFIYCAIWGLICIPFLMVGFIKIKKIVNEKPKAIILLAMSGAFIFVISSLKIPSVTGSCSHMTGTGLSTILFGVSTTSILGIIVLIFQALLLAHGGLTTLGANTFSMAIAGPIFVFIIFKLLLKIGVNKKVSVFFAAFLGDIATYIITALQLAIAYPSVDGGVVESAIKFLAVFAPTQLPLAIIEGILTVLIIIGLETYARPELQDIDFKGLS